MDIACSIEPAISRERLQSDLSFLPRRLAQFQRLKGVQKPLSAPPKDVLPNLANYQSAQY